MDTLENSEAVEPEIIAEVSPQATKADPYAAVRFRNFRYLIIGRFISTFGEQAINVALGWELYVRTHSALALGYVGLALIVPVLLFSLPAGQLADQMERKRIVLVAQALLAVSALGLAALSATQGTILLFYVCIFFIGVGEAFNSPASSSLVPQAVPPEYFANAATWNSSAWQLASVIGPAFGGLIIALTNHATLVYIIYAAVVAIYIALLAAMRLPPAQLSKKATTLDSLAEGARFVWKTKVIFAAITLDMFAVLFGGATTLLPIFASDILHVGPVGLGWMRAAPSIGAVAMAFTITHLPPFRRAGRILIFAVIGFGGATIVFGVSHNFWLSLAMLALLGALDNISVVIRSTLMLVKTPDNMRGRAGAVNNLFVSASNELGGFESGLTASLIGPIWSVAAGGIGTIIVVLLVAALFPDMRRLGRLTAVEE